MSRSIRSMTLAVTLLVLCSTATYALPFGGRLSQEDFLTVVWDRLISWFSPGLPVGHEGGVSVMEKEGSQMDPNGLPASRLLVDLPGDAGSQMDPNGNK